MRSAFLLGMEDFRTREGSTAAEMRLAFLIGVIVGAVMGLPCLSAIAFVGVIRWSFRNWPLIAVVAAGVILWLH